MNKFVKVSLFVSSILYALAGVFMVISGGDLPLGIQIMDQFVLAIFTSILAFNYEKIVE